MAKRITKFDPVSPGRNPIYPWDTWLDGSIWMLIQGEDFHCTPGSMIKTVRRTAHKRGLHVSVHHKDNTVVIKPRARS